MQPDRYWNSLFRLITLITYHTRYTIVLVLVPSPHINKRTIKYITPHLKTMTIL